MRSTTLRMIATIGVPLLVVFVAVALLTGVFEPIHVLFLMMLIVAIAVITMIVAALASLVWRGLNPKAPSSANVADAAEAIAKLSALREEGAISDEEFVSAKRKALGE